jgi:hypothetical protein
MSAALAVGTPNSGYWEGGFRTDATNPDGALRGERTVLAGGITLFNYDAPDIIASPTPVLIRMKAWATTPTTLYFWLYDLGNVSDNEAQFAVTTEPTYYEFYQQFNGSGFSYLELGTWNSVPVGTAIYFDDISVQALDVPDIKVRWGVRSKITDASQYRWSVRTKVTDAVTLRWPVRGYVVDAVKAVWNLKARVGRPYQYYWLVKQRTGDTQTFRYGVRTSAAKANTYRWSVAQRISDSFKGLFSLSRGETPWGETTPDVQSYSEATPDTQAYSETSDVNSIWTEIPPDTQSWV